MKIRLLLFKISIGVNTVEFLLDLLHISKTILPPETIIYDFEL